MQRDSTCSVMGRPSFVRLVFCAGVIGRLSHHNGLIQERWIGVNEGRELQTAAEHIAPNLCWPCSIDADEMIFSLKYLKLVRLYLGKSGRWQPAGFVRLRLASEGSIPSEPGSGDAWESRLPPAPPSSWARWRKHCRYWRRPIHDTANVTGPIRPMESDKAYLRA
jgi:hypothetical protein